MNFKELVNEIQKQQQDIVLVEYVDNDKLGQQAVFDCGNGVGFSLIPQPRPGAEQNGQGFWEALEVSFFEDGAVKLDWSVGPEGWLDADDVLGYTAGMMSKANPPEFDEGPEEIFEDYGVMDGFQTDRAGWDEAQADRSYFGADYEQFC